LFDSILLIRGREGTIWVTELSFGLVLIAPVILGAKLGSAAAKKARIPGLGQRASTLAALIVWPTCVLLPFGIATLRFQYRLAEIPVYANSRGLERHMAIFRRDGLPPLVELDFETTDDEMKVLRFYKTELGRRGWSMVEDEGDSSIHFEKSAAAVLLREAESTVGTTRLEIIYMAR
jgi:hypothetical protein